MTSKQKLSLLINEYVEFSLNILNKINEEVSYINKECIIIDINLLIGNLNLTELNEFNSYYLCNLINLRKKISKLEEMCLNYNKNNNEKKILLSSTYYQIHQEIDKLTIIKEVYEKILSCIKSTKIRHQQDSILKLVKVK